MNNHYPFYDINQKYRLFRRHERSHALTLISNMVHQEHNRVVLEDLQVRPPVPAKRARRVAQPRSQDLFPGKRPGNEVGSR